MESAIKTIPLEGWLAAIGVLFLAVTTGFVAGFMSARLRDRNAFRRARSGATELLATILKTLETARELCARLEAHPVQALQSEQARHFETQRSGLFDALARLGQRLIPAGLLNSEGAADTKSAQTPKFVWQTTPVDPSTELPDRSAFEANLTALLKSCSPSGRESSLLLVRVDKMPALVSRVGHAGIEKLIKKLAHVVCRAVRDDDLVCRCNSESLGILFPELDLDSATRLGRVIRDSVRNHHFHVEETGPEVLLTASFGCTPCRANENADLVLNRAFDALTQSQRLGRNQLHVHNGSGLVHCAAI
ncbi:MAG: GGDEF domain-containing protein [Planctomycetia bacterium]|nr:GGDEF domain-containing protein [Planctomycetia bacterium]